MAKSKKSAKKPTKPAKKSTRSRKKAPPPRMSAAEKAAKLKPGDDLNELIADVLTAWELVKRKVRVADMSSSRLASLARRAAKASKRESDLAAKQASKLSPLTDARIIANDAAYRAALGVKRIADAVAETDQAVADAFADVSERFRHAAPAKIDTPAP